MVSLCERKAERAKSKGRKLVGRCPRSFLRPEQLDMLSRRADLVKERTPYRRENLRLASK
jgi:hypothetical protein